MPYLEEPIRTISNPEILVREKIINRFKSYRFLDMKYYCYTET